MGEKLNTWCRNIMLVCGTITSFVGAVGSVASLILKYTRAEEKSMMESYPAPAPADPGEFGMGGPYNPVSEPFDIVGYMPEIFLVGIIILCIAFYLHMRIKRRKSELCIKATK